MFVPFVLPRDSERLEARLAPRLRPLDAELLASVLERMHDVQKRGDSALLELTRTIDGIDLRASAVPLCLVDDAVAALSPALRRAIEHALENIVSVNEAFLPANREHAIRPGTLVGERFTPLASVGLWVPARKGPLVSSALMLAGAARAARVPRIAVATAPLPGGGFEPTTFAAARLAGASEFYVGNGVGMIAALCFGTASIAPVDGIFGPGPAAMLAAMGLAGAFGVRTAHGIGPTDCMILADGSADPVAVALDLMTEAEHGPDSAAVLVTPSEALARAVCGALAARLPAVEPARRAVLEHSFGPAGLSALALVPDWRAACGLAQSFAPEHLMLVGDEAEALAGELSCAGEVLRGPATPFAAANYAIGVTAVLPTNGFARRFSGVTAKDMLRMTTTASLDASALEALAPTVTALAGIEGLPCHAAALTATAPTLVRKPLLPNARVRAARYQENTGLKRARIATFCIHWESNAAMALNEAPLKAAATIARGLAIDAVHASQSGHLGLPLGCAEIGAVLFGHALKYAPKHPEWLNRDRFVLSAGHGSMFLYAWLHLSGYADMTMDEIKRFRQLNSKTPGHPELTHAPSGVETTTGPLGQGVGNAVGMAVSAKMAAARFNTAEHVIFDHKIVVLAGDGCLQEGVALECVSFAGHQKLDNLILIYDSNKVTLDAMASETQSENTAEHFDALGFDVQTIDGHDMNAFLAAFERAKGATSGKPQLIIAETLIGKGIPEVAGTAKAHGEGGAKFAKEARKALGLPDEPYYVAPEVHGYFVEHEKALDAQYEAWTDTYLAWKAKNPQLAEVLASSRAYPHTVSEDTAHKTHDAPTLLAAIPQFPADAKIATRKAGQDVLQPVAELTPLLIGGSADLYGSTLNYIGDLKKGDDDFNPAHRSGRNIRFGIREHGMCSILNGVAAHGIFRPSGATFLVFADYCRAAIRLAALSHLPVIYIFTHDSVGVGEDGPTHEPVETVPGLRVIPNLDVIRPADPEETAGAFVAALTRTEGPTLLALSRQAVPNLTQIPADVRRQGVLRGGYIAKKETAPLDLILLSAGSELQHALKAAESLGAGTRVVSIPSFYRFERQPAEYREEVLPKSCRKRVSIEASVPSTWARYVGLDGASVGIDRFGLSAPGGTVMKELGITAEHVVEAAKSLG